MKKLLFIILSIFLTASTMFGWGMITVGGGVDSSVGGCTIQTDIEAGSSTGGYQVGNNTTSIYRGTKLIAGGPGTYDICKVIFRLRKTTVTAHTQEFKAEIWTTDGGSPPVPSALSGQASDTAVTRDSLTTSFADVTFEWSSATKASVTNGNYYWIVIHMTGGTVDSTNYIEWEYTGTGTGAGADEDIANSDSTPTWGNTTSYSTLLGETYR